MIANSSLNAVMIASEPPNYRKKKKQEVHSRSNDLKNMIYWDLTELSNPSVRSIMKKQIAQNVDPHMVEIASG